MKIQEALSKAWDSINGAHTTDPQVLLNKRMQELIPGPYEVKIEYAPFDNVADTPTILSVIIPFVVNIVVPFFYL